MSGCNVYDSLPPKLRQFVQEHAAFMHESYVRDMLLECGTVDKALEILNEILPQIVSQSARIHYGPDHPEA